MIEFQYTGDALWTRMERAVERVTERLRKTVQVLEKAKIPYAVVGGNAVRAWVAQVDEAAVRTTRDVDILIRPSDLTAMIEAMTRAGFYHRRTAGLDMFVEDQGASARCRARDTERTNGPRRRFRTESRHRTSYANRGLSHVGTGNAGSNEAEFFSAERPRPLSGYDRNWSD